MARGQGGGLRQMVHFGSKISADPERAVVVLVGDCDLSVRDQLTTLLLDAVRSARVVVVDLAGVTFMDSSGLHALMTAHHAAQRTGGRLSVRGATGAVAGLLEITGLRTILSPAPPAQPAPGTPASRLDAPVSQQGGPASANGEHG